MTTTDDTVTIDRATLQRVTELAEIGDAVVGWALAARRLGHVGPLHTGVYMHSEDGTAGAWFRDFMGWAGGHAAETARMETWVDAHLAAEVAA